MPSLFLYSVNPLIKLHIQQQFRHDVHYVWCSEQCDSSTKSPYDFSSLVPASSNPKDIYARLRDATGANPDFHNENINRVKNFYLVKAPEWERDGEITRNQRIQLVYMINNAQLVHWRPILYVIQRGLIDDQRLREVDPDQRAGLGMEYIIEDLRRHEFDIVEL